MTYLHQSDYFDDMAKTPEMEERYGPVIEPGQPELTKVEIMPNEDPLDIFHDYQQVRHYADGSSETLPSETATAPHLTRFGFYYAGREPGNVFVYKKGGRPLQERERRIPEAVPQPVAF
jgi:hypothetical protein